jgi:hypothetical protein
MNFAIIYLAHRILYRLGDFFHHWYWDGSRNFARAFIASLENLDRTFAVRLTFKFLFQPLYKDYSPVGRLLGPIFRSGRVAIGGLVYVCFALLFFFVYLAWLLLPPVLIIYAAIQS